MSTDWQRRVPIVRSLWIWATFASSVAVLVRRRRDDSEHGGNDTFSERLNASIGGETGDASASGSFSLLGAQQTNSADLVGGLGNADTSTAGAKSGTATISPESDGGHQ